MASIIYRKFTEPSKKSKWISPNRKYKWLFYLSFSFNILFIIKNILTF